MNAHPVSFKLLTYASIKEAETQFERMTHCTSCRQFLSREFVYRRAYELQAGWVLAIFCNSCNTSIPQGSPADAQFRQRLERMSDATAQTRRQ